MRILVVVLSLLVTVGAFAQQSRMKRPALVPDLNQFQVYPLAMEMRYEKDSAGNWLEQKPQNLSFAYRATAWSILFEYSKFDESSGNSTLNIKREHSELLLWGRWHLWRQQQSKALRLSVYGAGGLGTYTENVTTTLSGTTQTDSTGSKMMGGFAAGADVSYDFVKSFGVVAAVEGRGLMGQEFDPNPTFGGVARAGFYYSW
ncbi:hypothetical protein ACLVWU_16160 [Bdellovibrio sp. HCB290]|uniref:hypothetical protein n=1 Tax=Bdellovibrio sp. HCB290 TaxID=3394356 RepID=UPI0039B6D48F